MLKLKSLTFSGIGRFVEEQTINFDALGLIVQLEGKNSNTGGSSGSGKSTVFKALDFLFGVNDVSTTVLQSRLTKENMCVTGLFDLNGIPLKIERGKKLLIDLNGEITTGSSKLTEEKLDQIIGMPRDLFRKVFHKRQGEGGFFLDMGPSEVHKFLTSCLSLDKEQDKVAKLDQILGSVSTAEVLLKTAIESNKSGIEATKNALASLGKPPVLGVDPLLTQHLLDKVSNAKNDLFSTIQKHKEEIELLEKARPQIITIPFDRTEIERLESEIAVYNLQIVNLEKNELKRQSEIKAKISELRIKINNLNNEEKARQTEVKNKIEFEKSETYRLQQEELARQAEVRSKINLNEMSIMRHQEIVSEGSNKKELARKLAEELKKIQASTCPTCEQGWVNDAANQRQANISVELRACKAAVMAGMEAGKQIEILQHEKNQLDEDLKPRPIRGLQDIALRLKVLEQERLPRQPITEEIFLNLAELESQAVAIAIPEVFEIKLKIDFIKKELVELRNKEKEHQSNENFKNQEIISKHETKMSELRNYHDQVLYAVRSTLSLAESALMDHNHKIRAFDEAKLRFDSSKSSLDLQLNKYSSQLQRDEQTLSEIQEEIELATESKKAIKSYLSASFEDALDALGDTATRFIRCIPNMTTATIQFEGLKENKDGKVKEEITCLVSMDGEIGIPLKSLSGGERSSCDLCVDLAVIQFIEDRTNNGIDLYILDEPFTGLDTISIQDAIEMVKNSVLDKRIILVDHNPIAAESIENRITVIRDGLTSKIV